MKYNLMKLGFGWKEIDELDPREIDIILALYGAIATKERGFG